MNFKKLLATGIVVVSVITQSIPAFAVSVKDVFDAKYYASQYEDLQNAFGDNEKALFNHYLKYGLKEGRNASPVLDIAKYREAYSDLDEAFGDNWDLYVKHFFEFGAAENRDEGVLLNPIEYAKLYSDIKAAFGDDITKAAKHYLEFGIKENRTEGTAVGYSSLAEKKAAEKAEELLANIDNNKGDREEKEEYSSGYYSILKYNAKNELIEKLSYTPDNALLDRREYTYTDGNLASQILYNADNSVKWRYEYKYSNGNNTGTIVYNADNSIYAEYGWTYAGGNTPVSGFRSFINAEYFSGNRADYIVDENGTVIYSDSRIDGNGNITENLGYSYSVRLVNGKTIITDLLADGTPDPTREPMIVDFDVMDSYLYFM